MPRPKRLCPTRPIQFDMHEDDPLIERLEHIAATPCAGEERVARALTLVKADIAKLRARLGIGRANRLPVSTKSSADQRLAELRRRILAAEVDAEEPARMVFTAARHRMEMARRVLASRIVEDDGAAAMPSGHGQQPRDCARAALLTHPDWQLIAAMRRRLGNHEQVARSKAAIEESLSLLGVTTQVFRSDPPRRTVMTAAAPASAA
jgi:hypothetical protein